MCAIQISEVRRFFQGIFFRHSVRKRAPPAARKLEAALHIRWCVFRAPSTGRVAAQPNFLMKILLQGLILDCMRGMRLAAQLLERPAVSSSGFGRTRILRKSGRLPVLVVTALTYTQS